MMEAGREYGGGLERVCGRMEERSLTLKTYDFNILVSHSWRTFKQAKDEIKKLLKDFGDENPLVEKTVARGVCGVKTVLDAREVIKKVRAIYEENPMLLSYTIKWAPVDNWCQASLEEMKKALEKEKGKILKGEKWAMKVEKRRYTKLHGIEIIRELAELIDEKVDLENPDRVVRVEILGEDACISVVKPEEVFSTMRPR